MITCLKCGANDLHMVQLMPMPPRHLLLHYLNPHWFDLSDTSLPTLSWKSGRQTGVCLSVVRCRFPWCETTASFTRQISRSRTRRSRDLLHHRESTLDQSETTHSARPPYTASSRSTRTRTLSPRPASSTEFDATTV